MAANAAYICAVVIAKFLYSIRICQFNGHGNNTNIYAIQHAQSTILTPFTRGNEHQYSFESCSSHVCRTVPFIYSENQG